MTRRVQLVGRTEFIPPEDVDWETDVDGGQALVEFAGRACYQSWSKPNPETATNQGYIANIKDHKHFSVLEHGTISLYFQGISRTLSHELIRHRHFSYSELSQRYVNMESAEMILHPTLQQFMGDDEFNDILVDKIAIKHGNDSRLYARLVDYLERHNIKGKKAREAARGIMSANLETKVVITGNYRAWRHWLVMRGSEHADAEINSLALEVFTILLDEAPNVFDDFNYSFADDNTVTGVWSPLMEIV